MVPENNAGAVYDHVISAKNGAFCWLVSFLAVSMVDRFPFLFYSRNGFYTSACVLFRILLHLLPCTERSIHIGLLYEV